MKNIFICLLLFITITAHSQDVDLGFNSKMQKGDELPSEVASLASFRTLSSSMKNLLKWNKGLIEKAQNLKEHSRLKLSGFNTNLAVSLSGGIGVLNFSGQSAYQLFWERLPGEKAAEVEPQLASQTSQELILELDSQDDQDSMREKISHIIANSPLSKGARKIDLNMLNPTLSKFMQTAQKLDQYDIVGWQMKSIGIELELGLSVAAGTVFVVAGGDMRLRLQWKKNRQNFVEKATEQRALFSDELNEKWLKSLEEIQAKGFHMKQLRLGLSLGADGELAPVSFGASVAAYIWLEPKHLAIQSGLSPLFAGKAWNKSLTKINRKAIRLAKRIAKQDTKPGQWGVRILRLYKHIDTSGGVGVVTFNASPNVEIDYENNRWAKPKLWNDLIESETQSTWRLSGLRLRTRAEIGVMIPWISKVSFRPFVELHYK